MNAKKWIAATLAVTLAAGLFAGCGSKDNSTGSAADSGASDSDKVITIGASVTPHADVLNHLTDEFAAEGYELKVVEFTDYVQPNKALEAGDLDANYFQHQPYLDNFNEENGSNIVSVGANLYIPMAIFSKKLSNLDNIPDGATVAVPNDTTNEARALLLLQENGFIKLKDGVDIKATVMDVEDNPHNLKFVEMDAAQIPRAVEDTDLAIVNGNFALDAGLNLNDALLVESADSLTAQTYANVIAVRGGEENTEKTKTIVKILTSEDTKQYIKDSFNGAVLPV